MRRIPADIDALMWSVAESGDHVAIDDFEKRFPEFRGELGGRLAMVRGLRKSKPTHAEPAYQVPRFVLRNPPVVDRRPIWTAAMLGGLAVVAFGSYLVVLNLPKTPAAAPTVPQQGQGSILDPRQPAGNNPEVGEPGQVEPETMNPTQQGQSGGGATTTAPPAEMPWDKPQSIEIQEAPLDDVLKMIAGTCALELEIGPGMPNPTVSVKFTNKTGLEMLRELGRLHGFTPLSQGRGRVLVIPALEYTNPS